ncbi:MAG: response regulator transcription factor [Flavobacteriales bacterium]|nr:response regulator transcription factor [Flavobacteriales bacterium]
MGPLDLRSNTTNMIGNGLRLAIVDDHTLVREGFAALLNKWPHGSVVVQAEDGVDYERACGELGHIHIAVVDLQMPRRDGFETIQWITRHQPRTLALAISIDASTAAAQRVVRAGGRGLLCKSVKIAELHLALDHVRTAGFYYNSIISKALRRQWEDELVLDTDKLWNCLSDREKQVVLCYADPAVPDLSAVAQRTGIKYNTAETHRRNAFLKLGVHDKAGLVHLVLRNGWK